MSDKTFPLEDLSGLEINSVSGDLHLNGWSRDEIRIRDTDGNSQVESAKDLLQASSTGDLIIHIPYSLPVHIKSTSGDAALKGIASDLKIDSVAGDLSLRDVGSTTMATVGGDLIASRVQGVLRGDTISGDVLIDNVQGQVELKSISGDAQLEKVDGGIDFKAAGDGMVDFHPVSWQAYCFEVGGDLSVTMPSDSDADLSINSGGEYIYLFPGKLDIKNKEKTLEHKLGEGGTSIKLSAGGKVFVMDDEFTIFTGIKMNLEDLGSITADFSTNTAEQIRSNLGDLEEELRESLSSLATSLEEIGLSEESLKNLGEQIEETSRKAAEKAEIAAIKAQAKAEKKIAKARRKALEAREKTKHFDLNKFLEEKAEKDSVTEKERILILKMLQDKKISAEEADELLKALEGKRK